MNFKLLLKNQELLTILHNVLENKSTNKENIAYNQYSLLIIIDLVIKYQIIINDESCNLYFLNKLNTITNNYKDHKDLVIKGNSLLIDIISDKFNLSTTKIEDKKKILHYIYDRYIVNGYCYHSFPSIYKSKIEELGLNQNIDIKELNDLKKIDYIFSNHNYKNIFSRNLKETNKAIYITDSIAMAYFYAIRSPLYMAEITSLNKYYKYVKKYYLDAYYEKNYQKCKDNLLSLCRHVNMTRKEEITVMKTFDKRWNTLDLSNSRPCIAFIKRSDLAKDSLPNIKEIINSVEDYDLNILMSKITDSKYPVIRKYSDINPLDLKVVTMPSYKEIKTNNFLEDKKELPSIEESKKEEVITDFKCKYSYSLGNANIIALTGLLLISLGLTLSIILKVVGG